MEIDGVLQMEKQYQDERLLFEVYEIDETGRPTRAKLLSHSPSHVALDEFLGNIHCDDL